MAKFNERDVKRHYDLLQHRPELGLTQLKAMDGENIIGIGLFDNEEDFVSECRRYNELGDLFVGVNPRSLRLLDDYGGLKNRMRTLFMDVAEEEHIDYVTGVVVREGDTLSDAAERFREDASVLSDQAMFFPLDEPIPIPQDGVAEAKAQLATWFYGTHLEGGIPLTQFARVMGTALQKGGWLRSRRTQFRKYRPYILEGITAEITGQKEGA